ncbi:MAG TPA: translocation/assembly module TamB domain-containing protein, partial [Candidatus Angelobacter sp.]
KQVALNQSYIKTPQTSLTLNGKVSDRSQLQIHVQSGDLHELELVAANFSKPAPGQPQQELGLYGTAVFSGGVKGSIGEPQLTGQFAANNLRVKGSAWRVLRANISANPSLASLTNGDLESATRGRINFDAQARLSHWAYKPANPIVVKVSASQLSIADLERLAGQTYPISGTLSIDVSMHGSQLNPVGNGNVTLVNAKVAKESIQSLNLRFQGTGDAVNANLTLQMPAGTTRGTVTYFPKTEAFQAQLQAANLRLEKVQNIQSYQVNGGLNLNASGQGTVRSPEITASLQIPTLQVKGQTIRGFKFDTTLRNRVADIALNSDVAETYVKATGTVGMDAPYMTNLRVDTGRIPFQPLLAVYLPAQAANMGGQTELHATLRGPLQDKSKMEAHLEVPMLAVNYKDVQLAATKPIRLDYQNDVATLQPAAIQGTGTDIQMQGRVPVSNLKAASFLAQGTIDLRLAQLIQPDIQSSGQIKFDINSQRYSGSNMQGEIQLVNGNIQAMGAPLGLSNANGLITVTRERLQISRFQGEVGGGTVTATGGVAYHPSVQFNLALKANNVRLRYPDGVRTMLGSNLSLTGSAQAALLTGQVRIEHVSFTPDFDLATFIGQFSGESSPPPQQGLATNIKMNVAVQSTSEMNLVSSKVSLQGFANLRVVGTAADPVILGRANLSAGELFVGSNRYVIQSGTIDFLNPVETQPVVNLHVTTLVDQYNIGLHFEGPIARLQTSYSSEPPLPPVDIINLLAFGKTTEASEANPSPTGTAGAEGLLAQGISSQVSSRVAKLAGISQLSIDPTLGGDQSNPGARIAIQQRVTGNLFVTFATDVTSTQRQQIKIEYKLNPRWSLSGVRDQNGGLGVDAKYKKTF